MGADRPYGPMSQVVTADSGANAFQRRFRAAAARSGTHAVLRAAAGHRAEQHLRDLRFGELFSLRRTAAMRILASGIFRRFGVPSPDVEALQEAD